MQKAGEACYSEAGQASIRGLVDYYMKNARTIYDGLKEMGYTVYSGVNSPYIWLKTVNGMTSWEFFDYLLEHASVVGTPGSGFGPSGEGFFRLTAFGTYENSLKALDRIRQMPVYGCGYRRLNGFISENDLFTARFMCYTA